MLLLSTTKTIGLW